MGTWGGGLYSDDYALDLRSSVSGVSRLPLGGDELLAVLRKEESCADNDSDQDHFTFWLVTADQFTRLGIQCQEATQRALDIIDKGPGLERLRAEGLPTSALRQREKKLAELAQRLLHPPPAKSRTTLKKRQPLLLQKGQAWCYPTMKRDARNPYFATAEAESFKQDGWGAFLVVDQGHAFEMIAWYAVVPAYVQNRTKPTLEMVRKAKSYQDETFDNRGRRVSRVRGGSGTLSPVRLKRMEFQLLGELPIAAKRVPGYFTEYAKNHAVTDRCLSNELLFKGLRPKGLPLAKWLVN